MNNNNIRYSHATHEEYNKRFEPKEPPSNVDKAWISRESIPTVLQDFNQSNEYVSMHLRVESAEYAINDASQAREEEGGRGSGMVRAEKPQPEYNPPPNIRYPVDQEHFRSGWLKEQHDAAMHSAKLYEQRQQREQDYQLTQTQNRSNDYDYTR